VVIDPAIHRVITIAEHEALLDDSRKLLALECAGVDNWVGYDMAMEDYYSDSAEEDL
jgi:hypothetical protein